MAEMAVSMDQLIASLDSHCDVAANPFDTNRPHPHFSNYARLREPASLMGDQNKRRAEFLERQKSKRDKLVSLKRRLLESSNVSDEESKAPDSTAKTEEGHWINKQSKWKFANQLMLSEWLVDVPTDLEENWLVKPCPKGRRMLVVAHQGTTKAYSKAGHIVATFRSVLPSGGSNCRKGITILDCVWNWENRTYYVLDVLAWNNVVLLDCETEFRFYWLKTKLDEHPELACHSETNRNAFVALPSTECSKDCLTELMSHYPLFSMTKDPGLDGMLFYHKHNLYEHGSTPLVTWIKPFMMEDVLGIHVNSTYMEEKPTSYCDQAGYIREFEEAANAKKASFRARRHMHRKGRKVKEDDCSMDCSVEADSNSKMEEETAAAECD